MEKTNGSFELTKDGITLYVNSERFRQSQIL